MMSSIETRPSVPPYSSITSARWVWVACILSSRSSARIEGGTNRMGRRDVGDAGIGDSAIGAVGFGLEQAQHVLDMDQAGGIVQGLAIDRQARMLRLAEQRHQFGQRRCSSSTATMSARGTITSRDLQLAECAADWPSITRSCADKRRRLALAFLDHLFQAFAHRGGFARPGRVSFCSRRFRAADVSLMVASRGLIGIGDAQPGQDLRLPAASIDLGVAGAFMVVARPDAARHAPPDGWHDRQASCRRPWLPAASRHRRARCRRDNASRFLAAGKDSTLVGLSLPRKSRLSAAQLAVAGQQNGEAAVQPRRRCAASAAALASRAAGRDANASRGLRQPG